MDGRSLPAWAAGLLIAVVLVGCGTMRNGRGWGQDATLAPGWERVGAAAWRAAAAPETWAPAAGALAFSHMGHADQKVSDWASQSTPLFGSQDRAEQMSDDLARAADALCAASILAAPSGEEAADWTANKLSGFGVQAGSAVLLRTTVGELKDAVDRTRPNGQKGSMPSGHTATTALSATMASKNAGTMGWSSSTVTVTRIGLGALTAATAWARVEANYHYPSDVLAGAALGHFFGVFFTDAFLGIDDPRRALVLFEPTKEGVVALVRLGF